MSDNDFLAESDLCRMLRVSRCAGVSPFLAAPAAFWWARINAHQVSALLVQAEEAFWAGDKAAEGALKHAITGETVMLEPKGVDPVQVRSCSRVLFTSNEDWVVPATHGERRFFVLDVSEANRADKAYFAALMGERNLGGAERLLHELLGFDLSAFDVCTAPRTEALADQVIASLPPTIAWWHECLQQGHITDKQRRFREGEQGRGVVDDGPQWVSVIRRDLFEKEAREHVASRRAGNFLPPLHALVRMLRPYMPATFADGPRIEMPPFRGDRTDALTSATRVRTYIVPPLAECRNAFEVKVGRDIAWPADDGA